MIRTTLLAALVLSTSIANAAPPPKDAALEAIWAGEPFSVAPEMLKNAAPDAPAGAAAEVLWRSQHVAYDAEHKHVTRTHVVLRVLTSDGIEQWGTLTFPWAPWHEARPVVRARVVTADGRMLELDPKTLTEATPQGDPLLVQDAKQLIAPLPGVGRGATIELTSEVRETSKRYPTAGASGRFLFATVSPTRRARLLLTSPPEVVLAHHATGLTLKETITPTGRRLEVVAVPTTYTRDTDVDDLPAVAWSTGGTWQAMARAYLGIVERARGDKAPTGALTASGTRRQKIDKLLSDMRARIRYTGLELGESTIVPYSPAEVWRREYGDCKDMAVLLVAALAEAGVSARVALLSVGRSKDIDPALPGLDLFDHAIVYVPAEGAEPAMWIDPTATGYGAGSLPPADTERWALVIDPATTAPIRTTGRSDTRYGFRSDITVKLDPFGANAVTRRIVYTGAGAPFIRPSIEGADEQALLRRYDWWREADLGGKLQHAKAEDRGDAVTVTLTGTDAGKLGAGWSQIIAYVPGYDIVQFLPQLSESDTVWRGSMSYDVESRVRFEAPAGFVARGGLGEESIALGPITWKQTAAKVKGQDNVVEVTITYSVGSDLTAAEVTAFRAALSDFMSKPRHSVVFHHAASALIDAGSVDAALSRFREDLAKAPTDGETRVRFAIALSDLGMNEVARIEAARAVKDQPQSKSVLWVAGIVHSADPLGRLLHRGWDRPGAIALLRKLVKLDPTWTVARAKLAETLVVNRDGGHEPLGPEVEEALGLYRQLALDDAHEEAQTAYGSHLWRLGRYAVLASDGGKLGAKARGTWLAALAIDRGSAAALEVATRDLPPGEQQTALTVAQSLLLFAREYPRALELAQAISARFPSSRAGPTAESTLVGLKRRPTDLDRATPEGAYLGFLADLGADLSSAGVVRTTKKVMAPAHARHDDSRIASTMSRSIKADSATLYEVGQDLIWHHGKRTIDAAGTSGWRFRLDAGVGAKSFSMTTFWIPGKDSALLVSTGEDYAELGERARILASAGDLASARVWLDWAREAARALSESLEGLGVWPPKGEATRETILAAAAWYAVQGREPHPDALAAALAALPSWSTEAREPVLGRLAMADPKLALPVLDALTPRDDALDAARATLMMRAGKLSDARALAEARLAADPGARHWSLMLSSLAMYQGDVAAAAKQLEPLVAQGFDVAANNYAWYTLFIDRATEETERIAQRAVDLATKRGGELYAHAALNTLTLIQLERGRWPEGVATLRRTIVDATDVSPEDWLLVGRLAEGLGYREVAKKAYVKVPKNDDASSSWHLAQRRLKKLANR